MTASLHWNEKVISTSGPTGGLTEKSASLNNWLFAEVHTVIKLLGATVADLKLHLDYGRVVAVASYQDSARDRPPPLPGRRHHHGNGRLHDL